MEGAESILQALLDFRHGKGKEHYHLAPIKVATKQGKGSDARNPHTSAAQPPRSSYESSFLSPLDTEFLPLSIAQRLATEAANEFDSREIQALIRFLQQPHKPDREALQKIIAAKIEKFTAAELAQSGESEQRIGAPSGPVDAEIGLIMHLQTKKGPVGEFWDNESPSIHLLASKGFSPDFVYCYDWHWRAEDSIRRAGGANCSANSWTKTQRALHDTISAELLDELPIPWLLVAGSCPKTSYRKTLTAQSRRLTLHLSGLSNLEFELDFRHNRLRRITLYIPHPSTRFFQNLTSTCNSIIQDVATNFVLWIHNREFTPNSFAASNIQPPMGVPVAAPLKELYGYRAKEKSTKAILTLQQYDNSFLIWARKYLKEEPFIVLSRGDSLADTVIEKLGRAIHASYNKPGMADQTRTKNRGNVAERYGYSFRPFWDGQPVQVTKKGHFSIFISPDQPNLQLSGGRPLARAIENSTEPTTIHFSMDHISLECGGRVIYQKSRDSLRDTETGELWIVQMHNENACKGSAEV
jgi:hypothetical protein